MIRSMKRHRKANCRKVTNQKVGERVRVRDRVGLRVRWATVIKTDTECVRERGETNPASWSGCHAGVGPTERNKVMHWRPVVAPLDVATTNQSALG